MQDHIETIRQVVYDRRCVVLFGAGLSMPPGPSWKSLVDKLALKCDVKEAVTGSKPSHYDLVDACINKDRDACNQVLCEAFPALAVKSRMAANILLKLPFLSYLTTNFDPWFKGLASQPRLKTVWTYPNLPLHEKIENNLYYLHGVFDSNSIATGIESIVLGRSSFAEAYQQSLLSPFLLHVLVYYDVLFVGFDPREAYFAEVVRRSHKVKSDIARASGAPPRTRLYALWPRPSSDQSNSKLEDDGGIGEISNLGVTVGVFDRRNDEWLGLEAVLDMMWRQCPNNRFGPLEEGVWP